jgi:hypothetical protein
LEARIAVVQILSLPWYSWFAEPPQSIADFSGDYYAYMSRFYGRLCELTTTIGFPDKGN